MDVTTIRKQLGLSQAELAEILGVTQPAVAAWEAGRRTPTGRAASKLEQIKSCINGPTRVYGHYRGRPIELPEERWRTIPLPAEIRLPTRLDWSPRAAPRNLRRKVERAGMYAQVLDEGTPADIRLWIDPDDLVDLWPEVPVSRHMREPVDRLVETLGRAA